MSRCSIRVGLAAVGLATASFSIWIGWPMRPALANPGPAAERTIQWPMRDPLWRLSYVLPSDELGMTSAGTNGSGLELRDVSYKGRLMLRQAHVPVMNVRYRESVTPPTRLWGWEYAPMECDGLIRPFVAEPSRPPRTICDHPHEDRGTFRGVAVERSDDELRLLTTLASGWYRIVQQWSFRRDGRLRATLKFVDVRNPYHAYDHLHHAYFRFRIDPGGGGRNVVQQSDYYGEGPSWFKLVKEQSGRRDPTHSLIQAYRVRRMGAGEAVLIRPGDEDGEADAYGVADLVVLRDHSKPDETDDQNPSNDGRLSLGPFLDRESLVGAPIVFWYGVHAEHYGDDAAPVAVGPTLQATW